MKTTKADTYAMQILITYERHPDAEERNRFKEDIDNFCDMLREKYGWLTDVEEFKVEN